MKGVEYYESVYRLDILTQNIGKTKDGIVFAVTY